MKKENEINSQDTFSKEKRKSNILLLALKRHKISLLLVIFLLLVSGTLCWFILNTNVGLDLTGHVRSWKFNYNDGDIVPLEIDDLYPGMADQEKKITISNEGEMAGTVNIEIESLTLFGEEEVDYTLSRSDDGNTFTVEGYPFELKIVLGKNNLEGKVDEGTISDSTDLTFYVIWDYSNDGVPGCELDENGINPCDVEDTDMGQRSYEFSSKAENADKSSLIVKLKINIEQTE